MKGRELGLSRLANDDVDVRIGMRGTFPKHGPDPAKDDSAKVMPGGHTAVEVYLDELAKALVGTRWQEMQ